MSQRKLVRRAFADANAHKEFKKEKRKLTAEPVDPESTVVPGWGEWAGEGVKPKSKRAKKRLSRKNRAPEKKEAKKPRRDASLPTVIIDESLHKKTASLQASHLPLLYSDASQYERAMAGSLGREYNTERAYTAGTRPEIIKRAGVQH
eukprot:CAMPEP_0197551070 /NCGR_PEP_ID=MMETSP1320-20131121/4454_1 /TAXON_ID=91990 /ORGANISM="Bolidomonas sp., Strain RCC2347" /LENGTH=147 /DNA_ID=CAMNT_0043111513 /DNA_START=6 /DNA_END=449 /DNA_ORIENTATION=-